jgi:hypothetical protein
VPGKTELELVYRKKEYTGLARNFGFSAKELQNPTSNHSVSS